MGKSDGKVIIGTELDNSGAKKGVDSLGKDLSGTTKSAKKGIGGVSGALGGLGNVLKKVGGVIAAAFSISAVVNFASEAIQLGSDLQEVQNVVDVVFPTMTQQINDFAQNAVHTAGLSETMAKQYAGTFGAMANSFKFTESEAAGMSTTLTQLAGDVASFYNITQDEAFTKLSAVFTGETEALKHLGVVMTETALNEFAMQKGMDKTVQKMTEQEKVALRYKFVLEQLSAASGDFARTSDSWANQTRLLKVQFDQLKATIGQGLINALTPVIKVINAVIAKLQVLANAFRSITVGLFGDASGSAGGAASDVSNLADGYDTAADSADNLADSTKAAGDAAKRYLSGFDEIKKLDAPDEGSGGGSGGTGATSAGTGDLSFDLSGISGGATQTAALETEAIVQKIKELVEPLMKIDFTPLKTSLSGLGESFKVFGEVIGGALEWVWFNILVPFAHWRLEELGPADLNALAAGFDSITAAAKPLGDGLQILWDKLQPVAEFTGDLLVDVSNSIEDLFNRASGIFEEKGSQITEIFSNIGTAISALHTILEPVLSVINAVLLALPIGIITAEISLLIDRLHGLSQLLAGIFTGDIELAWSGLSSMISTELTAAGAYIDSFASLLGIDMDAVKQSIDDTCANIRDFFTNAWEKVSEIWSPVATWFNETVVLPIQEFFAPIVEWFGEIFGEIEQTVSDVSYNIGVLVEGCWAVIEAVWNAAPTWLDENVIQPIAEFFTGLWENIFGEAEQTWADIQAAYQQAKDWFDLNVIQPIQQAFTDLWDAAPDWAHDAYDEIKEIFEGIGPFFKGLLNGVIRSLNSGIRKIFSGVNDIIRDLRNLEIAGISPFSGLRTISTPQIPYLAQGAVLPPNKPFLAMVGDQRHGTNIEAPLATIQEAVALVMQDMMASNMAGHEATVAVLREILEAVLGIQIGDDVIAAAVDRHRNKMAVVRGGAL